MTRTTPSAAVALLLSALVVCACSDAEDAPPPEAPPGPPESFGVMTFNVLCSFCDSSYDPWDDRLGYFADIFERYDPDLLGLQELALGPEVGQMLELLPGHAALFFENDVIAYPDATVLYRKDRFEVVSRGEYWLSPTPEVPSSTGFAEHQLPRLVQWAELKDLSSRRRLYFASTHVDNNTPSQEKSAPLILERTQPWSERMAAVVVGDFNSQTYDLAYEILTEGVDDVPPLHNAQDLADVWTVEHNQPAEPDYDLAERIDHIFVAPDPQGWQVETWSVDLYVYGPNDRYPSDHRAMYARMTAPAL